MTDDLTTIEELEDRNPLMAGLGPDWSGELLL